MSTELNPYIMGAGVWGVSAGVRYLSKVVLKNLTNVRRFSAIEDIFERNRSDTTILKIVAPIAIGIIGIATGLISSFVFNNHQTGIVLTTFGTAHLAEGFAFKYYRKHRKVK